VLIICGLGPSDIAEIIDIMALTLCQLEVYKNNRYNAESA
jgi:hypothetical protein